MNGELGTWTAVAGKPNLGAGTVSGCSVASMPPAVAVALGCVGDELKLRVLGL